MAAAFVSLTSGAASRSVTVASGTDLLVAVAYSETSQTPRSATYGGVGMDVASNSNDWVQIFYMLAPPVGSATLAVSGTSIFTVTAAHYSGVDEFQAGQEGQAASASFNPSRAGLIVFGLSAESTDHDPAANTNERYNEASNEWQGDRIVASGGSVTVGAASATNPDYAGAIFLEPDEVEVDAGGTPAAPAPTASGSASVIVAAGGTPNAPTPTASGSVSVVGAAAGTPSAPAPTAAGSVSVIVEVEGSPSAPAPTVSGSAAIFTPVSGAPEAPVPTASGSASVIVDAEGDVAAPAPTVSGSASVIVEAGGTPSAPAPTVSGSVGIFTPVSGAPSAPAPTVSGSASVIVEVTGDISAPAPTIADGFSTVTCEHQLSEPERVAGYQQQRTGVMQAIRPFSGTPSIANLIDYINRELMPAVKQSREKLNDVYLQVTDNAPSGNPLGYYFSLETANADPTAGRLRLDSATQNAATTIRLSQDSGRLIDVAPWLSVMQGGATTPLGVVTLTDAKNPGRFLRFDLDSMLDQGSYWDLAVTPIESSHDSPFVEAEPIVVGFIPGVAASGATVPVAALGAIPDDTFLTNISGADAPATAEPLATLAGDGLTGGANAVLAVGAGDGIDVNANDVAVDVTDIVDNVTITEVATNNIQRAALTGFATAAAGSNATASAEPIVTYSASSNMSAERVLTAGVNTTVNVSVANQIRIDATDTNTTYSAGDATLTLTGTAFTRAAITGEVTIATGSNAAAIARSTNFAWTGNHTHTQSGNFSVVTGADVVLNAASGIAIEAGLGPTNPLVGDVLINAVGGVSLYAGATPITNVITNDITIQADGGVAINAGGVVTADPTAGDLLFTAPSGVNISAGSHVSSAADANDIAMNASGGIALVAGATPTTGEGPGVVSLSGDDNVHFATNGVDRLQIDTAGDWQLAGDPGASGEVMMSQGASAPPIWSDDFARLSVGNTFAGFHSLTQRFLLNGITTVSTSGAINNLAIGSVNVVRFTGAAPAVSGMVAAATSQFVLLLHAGTGTMSLLKESGSSSASNRFFGLTVVSMGAGDMAAAWYDATTSRWFVMRAAYD